MLTVWQDLDKIVQMRNTKDGKNNYRFGEDINLLASDQNLQLTGLRSALYFCDP